MWFTLTLFNHLDSSTTYCLISKNSSVSHSILTHIHTHTHIYMDVLWGLAKKVGISLESEIVITYIIRYTVSLHEKHQYETKFWNQDFY